MNKIIRESAQREIITLKAKIEELSFAYAEQDYQLLYLNAENKRLRDLVATKAEQEKSNDRI